MNARKLQILLITVSLFATPAVSESFGGTSAAQPNVVNMTIYRVGGLTTVEQETSGELVDYGLNKTFRIEQNSTEQYRFSFKIENTGSRDWTILDSNELFHDNLSSSWTVDKVWYNISQDYDGGTFSNNKLSWDTSQGGTLAAGSTMYAKYLVSIDENEYFRDLYFEVNDTSSNAGSFDYHNVQVKDLGTMNVNLTEPANDSIIRKDRTFLMNATVTCKNGECGEVTASPRYNESGAADTVIPLSGQPFNTSDNLETCSSSLDQGESCSVNFYINASGPDPSYHELDVNVSSNLSLPSNDSVDSQVSIETVILFDMNWSTVSFGSISPGSKNVSAEGNENRKYNITVDKDSITIDNMWIRATDLNSTKLDYSIPAENMSYSLSNDISTENFLSNSYQVIKSGISPGSVFTTYFWLDVPKGIYNGGYEGSIYFKGNSSS